MSYDIRLKCPLTGDHPHHLRGGTYILGGTNDAWLNITYNYSQHYFRTLGDKGIRTIYGMTGAESIPVLKSAAEKLKNDIDNDYWKSTEGNAKAALLQLISLAEMRPDGIWDGD